MAGGSIGLVIKIAAETRQAVSDIHDVNRALEGTGTTTGKTSKLMSTLGSVAVPVLGAVAVGAVAAAAALVDFGKAAWEDHQEAENLANVLRTIPGVTQDMIDANEQWITQTMFATHVVDTDLREAISQFTLVTGDLTQAQAYATASANLATVTNTEYGTVVDAVTKALAGKTRSLMMLAPWLDTNKDGTLSLAEAQGILTDKTLKGAAAAAAAKDPWTTISLIWDEIKEALGQWLLPLFERLGNWFRDPVNQKKIQEFIDKLGDMSYEVGMKLLPQLDRFLTWLTSPQGQQSMRNWAGLAADFADAVMAVGRAFKWANDMAQNFAAFVSRHPVPHPGVGPWSSASSAGYAAPMGVTPYGIPAPRAGGVTVNFYGTVTDPEATARAISSSLRGSQWRNGRARSLEPAW